MTTWAEFKKLVEAQGVRDEDTIKGIDWIARTADDFWFDGIRDSIHELLLLPENWDSYGAARIRPELAHSAATLLREIMDRNTPTPAIVPTTLGGVQIEWHRDGIDLEIEIESTSRVSASYADGQTGSAWEDEFTSDMERSVSLESITDTHFKEVE